MNLDSCDGSQEMICNTLHRRFESQCNTLQKCEDQKDPIKFILGLLDILDSKASNDRLIQRLDPNTREYFKIKFHEVRKIAINMYYETRNHYQHAYCESGVFGVGMILADAMIQWD